MAGLGKLGEILDEAGEETAALILRFHLEDIASSSKAASDNEAGHDDHTLACKLYEDELKEYQKLRGLEIGKVMVFKCVICEDEYDADHCYQVPCQHHYCDGCLNELFKKAMTDEDLYPPRCCKQNIPLEDVRFFLHPTVVADMDAKKEELDDPKKTYCYVPTCSTYIGEADKKENVATCPGCAAKMCLLCKDAVHDGDCAESQTDKQLLDLAAQEKWRKCPGCGKMIQLEIGCNHMTCRCKSEFCYVCGATWKTCDCPQWDENRLLARGQQVANREGEDIDAVLERLRRNHDCLVHDWVRMNGEETCDRCGEWLRRFIYHCRLCGIDLCARCRFNA